MPQLTDLESSWLALFWERQRLQWLTYAEHRVVDLQALDARQLDLAERIAALPVTDRRSRVLRLSALRDTIDLQPAVCSLRNRLDSPEPGDEVRSPQEAALQARSDVLHLMELRSGAAQRAGFPSYPEAVLFCEEIPLPWLRGRLLDILDTYLPEAFHLAKSHQLALPSWFRQLDGFMPAPALSDPHALWNALLRCLGLPAHLREPRTLLHEGGIAGYAAALHVPDDIRLLARPPRTLAQWITLLHELCRAVAFRSCTADGVFATWTPAEAEVAAVMLEQVATPLLLEEPWRGEAARIQLLEGVRCCISMLFELDLWENQEHPEALYTHWYSQLTATIGGPVSWACDSFRSIDPMCVFAYALGYALGREQAGRASAGSSLVRAFSAPGRSRPILDRLAAASGHGLEQ